MFVKNALRLNEITKELALHTRQICDLIKSIGVDGEMDHLTAAHLNVRYTELMTIFSEQSTILYRELAYSTNQATISETKIKDLEERIRMLTETCEDLVNKLTANNGDLKKEIFNVAIDLVESRNIPR